MLEDATRARLASATDLLIPAGDGFPASSEVETTGRWLDRVLAADPSILPALEALAGCDGWAAIEAFHDSDRATFDVASYGLLAAYYMHPRVRKLMGYTGQGPTPVHEGEAEHYLDGLDVDQVAARGPIYRATPDV